MTRRERPKDLEGLTRLLEGDDDGLAWWAAHDLVEHGSAATPALLGALDSGDTSLRVQVVAALSQVADERAVDALTSLAVFDDNVFIRRSARSGLLRLGAADVETLREGLRSQDVIVQQNAAEVIRDLGLSELTEEVAEFAEGSPIGLEALVAAAGSDARATLLRQLQRGEWVMRAKAASLLTKALGSQAVVHLRDALDDESWAVRREALSAVPREHPETEALLLRGLLDEVDDVRAVAAGSAG